MSGVLGVGILGTGRMARAFAAGLEHADGVELRAVGSRSQAGADLFASEVAVARTYASYAAVAADAAVDLVYIATPHNLHQDHCMMCLDAGKAVLCEKPFALNAAEAGAVIALARSKRLFLMEAMWTRFIPAVVRLRELLAAKVIGDVQLMIAGGAFIPDVAPDHYLFRPELGGGVLLDAGVYLVSMASMLFGTPDSVRAVGSLGATGVDEHEAMLLQFPGGAIANLFVSLRTRAMPDMTLLGEAGRIYVPGPIFAPTRLIVAPVGADEQEIALPFPGNGYQFQALEAARCMHAGMLESAIMPLDETLAIMRTMDNIRAQIGLRYPGER